MTLIKIEEDTYVDDELKYVNKHYGLNLKKGEKVNTFVGEGIILGGTHHVYVKYDKEIAHHHPQDIKPPSQRGAK